MLWHHNCFKNYTASYRFRYHKLCHSKEWQKTSYFFVYSWRAPTIPTILGTVIEEVRPILAPQNYFWSDQQFHCEGLLNICGKLLPPVVPHFLATTVKFGVRVWIWESLPQAKFCKKSHKGVYSFWATLYQKIPILGAVGPYFLSHNGEIWHEGVDLGLLPPSQIW